MIFSGRTPADNAFRRRPDQSGHTSDSTRSDKRFGRNTILRCQNVPLSDMLFDYWSV